MPSAPPEPPSPITAAIMGIRKFIISRRLTAIASEMCRSSEPIPVNLAARVAQLGLDRFYFRTKIDIVLARMRLQLLQTPFQFEDRLFKIERLKVHCANR